MRLANKRALVTGGASGIGKATVERFVREGAAVSISDLNASAAERLAEQLRPAGGRVTAVGGDVSIEQDARRMVEESVSFLGGLDILVNSAGIGPPATVVSATLEHWNRVIGVNLTGVFLMSKYAIPEMVRAGSGSIVHVGSVAAWVAFYGVAAYCASKGGVVELTRQMAADFAANNIRVNSVNPGVIDTPLVDSSLREHFGDNGEWQKVKDGYAEAHLLKRLGQPCEIANAILFLASDEASFMTGSAMVVDGGFSIKP